MSSISIARPDIQGVDVLVVPKFSPVPGLWCKSRMPVVAINGSPFSGKSIFMDHVVIPSFAWKFGISDQQILRIEPGEALRQIFRPLQNSIFGTERPKKDSSIPAAITSQIENLFKRRFDPAATISDALEVYYDKIRKGLLVDDKYIQHYFESRIKKTQQENTPYRGIIIDGIPRKPSQLSWGLEILSRNELQALVAVIHVTPQVMRRRQAFRATKPDGKGRPDDTPEAVRSRLRILRIYTFPVLAAAEQDPLGVFAGHVDVHASAADNGGTGKPNQGAMAQIKSEFLAQLDLYAKICA